MHQPRQLDGLALRQLAAWRDFASHWYFHLERRVTDRGHRLPETEQYHIVCGACGKSIAVMSSEGIGYLLNTDRLLDEVTRHLRNIHRGLEGEIYGGKGQAPSAGAGIAGTGNGSNSHPG